SIKSTAGPGAGILNLNCAGATLNGSGTVNGQVRVNASTSASRTQVQGVTINVPTVSGGVGIDVFGGATFVQVGTTAGVNVGRLVAGNVSSRGLRGPGGASADVRNSSIGGHNVGVLVDGGTALLQNNHVDNDNVGSFASGLQAQNGAIVDAGQLPGSYTPLANGPAGNS